MLGLTYEGPWTAGTAVTVSGWTDSWALPGAVEIPSVDGGWITVGTIGVWRATATARLTTTGDLDPEVTEIEVAAEIRDLYGAVRRVRDSGRAEVTRVHVGAVAVMTAPLAAGNGVELQLTAQTTPFHSWAQWAEVTLVVEWLGPWMPDVAPPPT